MGVTREQDFICRFKLGKGGGINEHYSLHQFEGEQRKGGVESTWAIFTAANNRIKEGILLPCHCHR
jgi:hypothetical protein